MSISSPRAPKPEAAAAESCGFIGQKLQTYQCKLRDDLTFSSGRKGIAADVEYSIERMMRIKTDMGPSVLFPSLKNVVSGKAARSPSTSPRVTRPSRRSSPPG